jgi:hypothetical protein
MHNHKNTKRGFTILVAVVTAGILLIVAMSIGGIALKEQVLFMPLILVWNVLCIGI